MKDVQKYIKGFKFAPLSLQKCSSTPFSLQSVHLWVTPGRGETSIIWMLTTLFASRQHWFNMICMQTTLIEHYLEADNIDSILFGSRQHWLKTWCPKVPATACLCNMSWGLVGTEHGTWKPNSGTATDEKWKDVTWYFAQDYMATLLYLLLNIVSYGAPYSHRWEFKVGFDFDCIWSWPKIHNSTFMKNLAPTKQ